MKKRPNWLPQSGSASSGNWPSLDPLTQLGNRGYTRMMLGGRLDELRRYGWPFGLLFIDVDYFKHVNDAHGHEVGDRTLHVIATTLLKSLRPFDFLGRWAGDEFLALIVNVGRDALTTVAERARILVERAQVEAGDGEVRVTVSVGGALARSEDTVDQLVARADALMYESKLAGRNQVRIELPAPKPRPSPRRDTSGPPYSLTPPPSPRTLSFDSWRRAGVIQR